MPAKKTSEIYQKMTPVEHILKRPDTYVGSIQPQTVELYVPSLQLEKFQKITPSTKISLDALRMNKKKLTYVPAFMKIFDEILVNAADNKIRDSTMTTISITIDQSNKRISVLNDGKGIPIEIHDKEKIYIPHMIFGHLLTSSNYDDSSLKVTGGRNGYGAKLTNLYSKSFKIITRDAQNLKEYEQEWRNNMKETNEAKIKSFGRREFKELFKGNKHIKIDFGGRKNDFENSFSNNNFEDFDDSFEEPKKSQKGKTKSQTNKNSKTNFSEPSKKELKEFELKKKEIKSSIESKLQNIPNLTSISKFNSFLQKIFPEFTEVIFEPDLHRFGMNLFDEDILSLLVKRACDLAGSTEKTCQVFLNGKLLPIDSFEDYMNLYIENSSNEKNLKDERDEKGSVKVFERVNERWSIGVTASDGHFQQISFVNSIFTSGGGKHVSHVADTLVNKICEELSKKTKRKAIKKPFVKNQLFLFINCLINNPSFTSQTKEFMSSDVRTFGSKCEPSSAFIKKLMETDILEQITSYLKFRDDKDLKKTDGKKTKRITGIPKLVDAHKAGTKESKNCFLILTEGDSAKQLAMSGLGIVGQDHYGIYPLKGKMLNVREATKEKVINNVEIEAIKKIVGLKVGMNYGKDSEEGRRNFGTLRYGKIMIMADQDYDGSHIKGLVINFVHYFWPSLVERNDFLYQMITPIVVAFPIKASNLASGRGERGREREREKKVFYSIVEFKRWRETISSQNSRTKNNWEFKYYKGLGTSTSKEGKEYFRNLNNNLKAFIKRNERDEKKIELAFEKKLVSERKSWLSSVYRDDLVLDLNSASVTYSDFVDFELINFSMYDVLRSIPAFVDGLKPVQRKILYTALKLNIRRDTKVSNFGASVSKLTLYHHGEMSLYNAIVGMAQNFTGSNNINLLFPAGQFGSRNKLGKDFASARYIHTRLEPIAAKLFPVADLPVLEYEEEDGKVIQPKNFVPILPFVLINGAEGIGTGWSTKVPCFNPREIVENVLLSIEGKEMKRLEPWYRGFRGKLLLQENGSYLCQGTVEVFEDLRGEVVIEVTEIPLFKDADELKKEYEDLLNDGFLSDVVSHCSEERTTFRFVLGLKGRSSLILSSYNNNNNNNNNELKANLNEILKKFKLTSSIPLSNMTLFETNKKPYKFSNILNVIKRHKEERIKLYEKRKKFLLEKMERELLIIKNKVRFILEVNIKKIEINNVKKSILEKVLEERNFEKFSSIKKNGNQFGSQEENENIISNEIKSFDYLLGMKIWSLTYEKVEELKKLKSEKEIEFEKLKKISEIEMWKKEINEFLEEYEKFEKEWFDNALDNEKYINEGDSKGKGKKKKKIKSNVKIGKENEIGRKIVLVDEKISENKKGKGKKNGSQGNVKEKVSKKINRKVKEEKNVSSKKKEEMKMKVQKNVLKKINNNKKIKERKLEIDESEEDLDFDNFVGNDEKKSFLERIGAFDKINNKEKEKTKTIKIKIEEKKKRKLNVSSKKEKEEKEEFELESSDEFDLEEGDSDGILSESILASSENDFDTELEDESEEIE